MKKARKVIAMVLVLALTVAMSVAGTIAYLKDTDDAKNVMTLGNVLIEQWEDQRQPADEDDQLNDRGLYDFEQNQKLFPRVDDIRGGSFVEDGFFNEGVKNDIDKIVRVENTGSEDAYVRTIFAFEGTPVIHDTYIGILRTNNAETWVFDYVDSEYDEEGKLLNAATVEIDGVTFTLAVATYQPILPAEDDADTADVVEDLTPASLKQFFLSPDAGNEIVELFGETYDIYAFSQGVQAAGFADAETALEAAFGEITATNNPWYAAA